MLDVGMLMFGLVVLVCLSAVMYWLSLKVNIGSRLILVEYFLLTLVVLAISQHSGYLGSMELNLPLLVLAHTSVASGVFGLVFSPYLFPVMRSSLVLPFVALLTLLLVIVPLRLLAS